MKYCIKNNTVSVAFHFGVLSDLYDVLLQIHPTKDKEYLRAKIKVNLITQELEYEFETEGELEQFILIA